jgi:hypothetical protein
VAESLQLDEQLVRKVMDTYAELALVHTAFHGPVPTVFGEMTLSESGLQISRQNPRILAIVSHNLSREELLDSVAAVIAEQGQ